MKRDHQVLLMRIYSIAEEYGNTHPTNVDINVMEVGKSIGLNEQEIQIAVQDFVNYGYVQASIGFTSLFITYKGIEYVNNLVLRPIHANKLGNLETDFKIIDQNYIMKQSEKLDLILNELYRYKNNGSYYSIDEICKERKIPIDSIFELNRLAHRLKDDGLIEAIFSHNDCNAELTSYGIDYCEQDSYTYTGQSVITNNYNISISNSPNSNIVNSSSHVNIEQQSEGVLRAIENIRSELEKNEYRQASFTNDIIECLIEIENGIRSNQKPKFAIKSLIELGSDISSIAAWVTTIGQFAGVIPKI